MPNRWTIVFAALTLSALPLVQAGAQPPPGPPPGYERPRMPPPRFERRPPPPPGAYAYHWRRGHWAWDGREWVWTGGRWYR